MGYEIHEVSQNVTIPTVQSAGEISLTFNDLPNGKTTGYVISATFGQYSLAYVGTSTSFMAIDYFNPATKKCLLRFSPDWSGLSYNFKMLVAIK